MSRSERRAADLPVSWIGGQWYFNRFAVGLGIADPETGEILSRTAEEEPADVPASLGSRGRNAGRNRPPANPDAAVPSEGSQERAARLRADQAENALINNYNVPEGDIQLLKDSGLAMVRAAEANGLTPDSPAEDIEMSLRAYAEDAGITLPEDMRFVVSAIRSGMSRMQQQ